MRVEEILISSSLGSPPAFLHNRRQMPVGQGGLHAGALKMFDVADPLDCILHDGVEAFGRGDIRYIYDCGSEPKRQVTAETGILLAKCPDRSLDLLFLSHFDRDHMNGIPRLLRKSDGFRVDTIILPYIDMAERIAALARAFARSQAFGGKIDGFFKDMVFDPGRALARFRPRRIIFVRPTEGEGPPPGTDPVDPPEFGPRRETGREKRGFDLLLKPAFPGDPHRTMLVTALPSSAGEQQLEVMNAAVVAIDPAWSALWKFLPYARAADPAALACFRGLVEDLFQWPTGEFDLHIGEPSVRKKMVTKFRTKMSAIYLKAFADKNLGSMSLYSGPAAPASFDALAWEPPLAGDPLTKIGWFGTGDLHLECPAERGAFLSFYGSDVDHASTVLLPHHGSIENSDPANLIGTADNYAAAADPVHPWKHPHWKLEEAAEAAGAVFKHVRRWPDTGFDEAFAVKANGTI